MRKRIKKPYVAAVFVVFFLCFAVKNALSVDNHNLTDCAILNDTGTYYLMNDIGTDNADTNNYACFQFGLNDTILDCQNNLILDNNTELGGIFIIIGKDYETRNNITVKNCRFSRGSAENQTSTEAIYIFTDYGNYYYNNSVDGGSDGFDMYNSYNTTIYGNTVTNCFEGILFSTNVAYNNITGNNFYNNSYGSLFITDDVVNNIIYNNIINDTGTNFSNTNGNNTNMWNTTRQSGTRIYSAGTEIGGNYWTNSTANGYSDTCADLDTDGFCDDPYDVEAGVACAEVADGLPACGNNTDWLPLSAFYEEPCVPSWNCTAWGECVRGYQNRVCTDDNSCQNETGKPAETQLCLKGLPNASFNVSTGGCCPISTIYCTNNETLLQVWNTSEGLSWASENCPYGCDNATSMCVPVPYQQNLWLLVIFAAIVVIGLAFIRWVR